MKEEDDDLVRAEQPQTPPRPITNTTSSADLTDNRAGSDRNVDNRAGSDRN
jgi:hypothetical protein